MDEMDIFNIQKVDNHVHLAAAFTGKHLLKFIMKKLETSSDEKVLKDKLGNYKTLQEVLEMAKPSPKGKTKFLKIDLTTDFLDVHADKDLFHRFDK
jgi:AMP deaminase